MTEPPIRRHVAATQAVEEGLGRVKARKQALVAVNRRIALSAMIVILIGTVLLVVGAIGITHNFWVGSVILGGIMLIVGVLLGLGS